MKALLETWQGEVFELLAAHAQGHFFLRRAQKNHCLWVSDLPRRVTEEALGGAMEALRQNDFLFALAPTAGLLEIDLSLPQYAALLAPLPSLPPSLPEKESLHPAYALCRLLLSRTFPLEEQPLAPLRSLLKGVCSSDPSIVLALIPSIHEQCALWLRQGTSLPHAAGRVLSDWISKGGS